MKNFCVFQGTKEYENALKNQLKQQTSSILEPLSRETREAIRELETHSIHSSKVKEVPIIFT